MKKTISIFVAALAPFALAMAEKPAEGEAPAPGGGKKGGAKDPSAMIDKMFEAVDTDENGTISLEEFKNKPERPAGGKKKPGGGGGKAPDPEAAFAKLDADADGEVTKEEMTAAAAARKAKAGGGKGGAGGGKGGAGGGKGGAGGGAPKK